MKAKPRVQMALCLYISPGRGHASMLQPEPGTDAYDPDDIFGDMSAGSWSLPKSLDESGDVSELIC